MTSKTEQVQAWRLENWGRYLENQRRASRAYYQRQKIRKANDVAAEEDTLSKYETTPIPSRTSTRPSEEYQVLRPATRLEPTGKQSTRSLRLSATPKLRNVP